MAKKDVKAVVKIQIPAGKATPAPPVGTALGPHGIQIMDFVKQYNAATEAQAGTIIPVDITIYEDRTFSFVLKTPPTSVLLRQKAGLDKAEQYILNSIAYKIERESAKTCEQCGHVGVRRKLILNTPCLCTVCYTIRYNEIMESSSPQVTNQENQN